MLPTCIGISGVSRYRNDASIEDSFLASLIFPSRHTLRGALVALLAFRPSWGSGHWPGLCSLQRRICNGKRPRSIKLLKFALGLGQTIRHRPQSGGVDAQSDMAGEVYLDIFSGIGGAQQARSPVHDAVGARIDRRGRNRQVA